MENQVSTLVKLNIKNEKGEDVFMPSDIPVATVFDYHGTGFKQQRDASIARYLKTGKEIKERLKLPDSYRVMYMSVGKYTYRPVHEFTPDDNGEYLFLRLLGMDKVVIDDCDWTHADAVDIHIGEELASELCWHEVTCLPADRPFTMVNTSNPEEKATLYAVEGGLSQTPTHGQLVFDLIFDKDLVITK